MTPPVTVDVLHVREDVGCHVYGVVRSTAQTDCEGLVGLDGAPTRLVVHGPVAAVVSDVRLERPPGRRADVMAYTAVLDAVAKAGPVVPVQFGSILEDEQDVVDQLLGPGEAHFEELLNELDGRAQFQLRADYRDDVALSEAVSADPRIARLRGVTQGRPQEEVYGDLVRLGELVSRAVENTREVDADVLLEVLVPLTAAHRVRLGSGVDEVAELTFLVDDALQDRFEQEAETLAEAVHDRIRLRLVGPLPPYDFVGSD